MTMDEMEPMVGLKEAISSLRSELAAATEEGAGKELRFGLGPVELEFLMGVTTEKGAEGGIKWWILTIGAKGSVATSATHRVKLTLNPLTPDEERARSTI